MSDEELRAYILTAVASHASKEMRRRSRKPTGPIGTEAEQVLTDGHLPLPDEIVLGSEARGVARDLLTSLPQRRRAVMLLRYGWGLSPAEVCALVPGLSPRAYRKEVTKGIEQLIERLRLGRERGAGAWLASRWFATWLRAPPTRTLGSRLWSTWSTVDPARIWRLACPGICTSSAASIALGSVAGAIGAGNLSLVDRVGQLSWALVRPHRPGRPGAIIRRFRCGTGAGRGTGAVGAGLVAKAAGAGGAGKAILACVGVGAAATACVAAGVVPGVSIRDLGGSIRTESGKQNGAAADPPYGQLQTAGRERRRREPSGSGGRRARSVGHDARAMKIPGSVAPDEPPAPAPEPGRRSSARRGVRSRRRSGGSVLQQSRLVARTRDLIFGKFSGTRRVRAVNGRSALETSETSWEADSDD